MELQGRFRRLRLALQGLWSPGSSSPEHAAADVSGHVQQLRQPQGGARGEGLRTQRQEVRGQQGEGEAEVSVVWYWEQNFSSKPEILYHVPGPGSTESLIRCLVQDIRWDLTCCARHLRIADFRL